MGTPIPNRRIEAMSSGSSEVRPYKLSPEEIAALPATQPIKPNRKKQIGLGNRDYIPGQRQKGRTIKDERMIKHTPVGKGVTVTAKQAKAIMYLLQPIEGGWKEDELIGEHANAPNDWRDEATALNGMPLGDLINALYVGMDIKEE
ncbi:hypothetical protein PAECIP112173_00388 [Paenibacillus sp. JJ-100]|uniref:hypothetical protein n=1 Tax=Paenibacillus sp. JJ-100 TaxID=2974896 RepID=UPI0022FFA1E9|nr:hypothetical protein [Paenibacillus sp. JJ-100]CAI6024558.1 hypothetical protein PAECIP112173_00388 [Paenibacillus sp. JJ-100]